MMQFQRALEKAKGLRFRTWFDMHSWALTHRTEFWDFLWKYLPIVHEGSYTKVVDESARIDSIPSWFEGVRMNYAENVLYTADPKDKSVRTVSGKEDDKIAITGVREGCAEIQRITWGCLRSKVGQLAQAMRAYGVVRGDRVAIIASNSIDTFCVLLAVTSLGGIFSSSSTDMGAAGILSRLLQIKPKWIFMDDTAIYNSKKIDLRKRMAEIVRGMEEVREFQGLVSQPRFAKKPADISGVPRTQLLATFLARAKSDKIEFERVPFRDPFLIVYSSGTTGEPKCIVHSVGGAIVSGHKECRLHHSLDGQARFLQYTTTGWIMYLVQAQAMLTGASLIMYDGSPFLPEPTRFVKLLGQEKATHLGISPRYLQTLQINGIKPRETTDLTNMRVVISTGMVLSEALFEWFYDVGFPKHAHLCNIAGGTDLAGCFGIGNPVLPLYLGGCQSPSLGMAVEVYDQVTQTETRAEGKRVEDGEAGELVATAAFPNMPIMFWGEKGQAKYMSSYFERFDNVWTHGDFVKIHPVTKQLLFFGRADGVLNPSGVRFGSAEIYNVIEAFFSDQIQDSICVGQRRPQDADESVMLFLLMKPGVRFTKSLVEVIKSKIGTECSKRHVPRFVFETPEIPTTVNLKKVELPVKRIVSGEVVKPSGTLLNPQCLDFYYQFAKDEALFAKPQYKL
ncbi:hypothetical protein IFR04_012315 [Cadophora malorum]|uniref:AMP-dependent synthetase/ligase domain-containing protein n=1 Tax=Cadophora malorum TaxID=108018 RepID=A0A8H7W469_9HELO|nr:hypothetical protein IFR04_012315 [Cadophora malorum]